MGLRNDGGSRDGLRDPKRHSGVVASVHSQPNLQDGQHVGSHRSEFLDLPKAHTEDDLHRGVAALADARQGKRTLRTHSVELRPVVDVSPSELIQLREERNISRGLLARYLRTNPRTLENWEQGRAKPNAQAALLINLVRRYPDTVERLASI